MSKNNPYLVATLTIAILMLSPLLAPASADGFPSADPSEPPNLLGGERLVYQLDTEDFDNLHPNSIDDVSGSGADGTVFGDVVPVAGRYDGGLFFGGSDDQIRIDNVTPLQGLGSEATFTAWVKQGSTNTVGRQILEIRAANNILTTSVWAYYSTLRFATSTATGATTEVVTNYNLPANSWVHVAFTFLNGDVALVIDGTSVWTGKVATSQLYAASPVGKAMIGTTVANANDFHGVLDDIRIYDRVLNGAEIIRLRDTPYFHPNSPPQVNAGPDIAVSCTGPATDVTLGATGSDAEGDALSYAWSSAGALAIAEPTEPSTLATFPVGSTAVDVTVSDSEFATTDALDVHVLDGAGPTIVSHFPAETGIHTGASKIAAVGDDIMVIGSIDVSAAAEDICSNVARVVFTVDDGTEVVDDAAPFGFTYAPEGVGIQYRTLTIVAEDEHGNAGPAVVVPLTVVTAAPRI